MVGRTGPRHSDAELFTATGERRQIYARDRAGFLVCAIPGCDDSRFTTRAGSRRDHFVHRHRGGAVHAPETWFHYTGKRLVGAWAQERYPEARVIIDKTRNL